MVNRPGNIKGHIQTLLSHLHLAGRGFEPGTSWLQVACSTNELYTRPGFDKPDALLFFHKDDLALFSKHEGQLQHFFSLGIKSWFIFKNKIYIYKNWLSNFFYCKQLFSIVHFCLKYILNIGQNTSPRYQQQKNLVPCYAWVNTKRLRLRRSKLYIQATKHQHFFTLL